MQHLKQTTKKRHRRKIRIPVLFLVCCVGFAISAWNVLSILFSTRQANRAYSDFRNFAREETVKTILAYSAPEPDETKKREKTAEEIIAESKKFTVDVERLQKAYPELSSWLRSEGTGIDYPVMHTSDNDYYLTRLYDGTDNINGSLFMDYRNTGVLTDDNTVLYGHNMKNGGMFHALNEYKAQEFFDDNPTMLLCTPTGDYTVDLICGTVESGDEEFVEFNFESFDEMSAYLAQIQSRSTFQSGVELQPGDRLVSLCTCTYERQNARYMLVGRVSGLPEKTA